MVKVVVRHLLVMLKLTLQWLGNILCQGKASLRYKFMCVCVCEIPLGEVAPAGWGCPPVSWQSSGSHGNEARDAPAPDLWCSQPPGELRVRERERESKTGPITQASSKMYVHEQFKGAAGTAETEVGQMKSWYDQLLQLSCHSSDHHFAVNLSTCSTLEPLQINTLN